MPAQAIVLGTRARVRACPATDAHAHPAHHARQRNVGVVMTAIIENSDVPALYLSVAFEACRYKHRLTREEVESA